MNGEGGEPKGTLAVRTQRSRPTRLGPAASPARLELQLRLRAGRTPPLFQRSTSCAAVRRVLMLASARRLEGAAEAEVYEVAHDGGGDGGRHAAQPVDGHARRAAAEEA